MKYCNGANLFNPVCLLIKLILTLIDAIVNYAFFREN